MNGSLTFLALIECSMCAEGPHTDLGTLFVSLNWTISLLEGKNKAVYYKNILKENLIPALKSIFPYGSYDFPR